MDAAPPHPQKCSQVFTFEFNFVQVDVDGDRLVMTVYNMDGDRIDRLQLP
jgi:hypothetical protein